MSEYDPTPEEIGVFLDKLVKWGRTLSDGEQALLRHMVSSATGGALSDSELDGVSGGVSIATSRPVLSARALTTFLPRITPGSFNDEFWAQWSARQY